MFGVRITGVGKYLPDEVRTNEEVAALMLKRRQALAERGLIRPTDPRWVQFECDPDWVFTRSGIRERRVAPKDLATSDLAARAAAAALAESGLTQKAVDFVLLATVTPDHLISPPTACLVQHKLGLPVTIADEEEKTGKNKAPLRQCLAVDLNTACSSFIAALELGYSLIAGGGRRAGLVIGADVMSRAADPNDRAIYPLLGDGAGCFVLERCDPALNQFLPGGFTFGVNGSLADLIIVPAGGSRRPIDDETVAEITHPLNQRHTLSMRGREVYKVVVGLVADSIVPQALQRAKIRLAEVDAIIFHQANLRISQAVVERLGYQGIVYNNIEQCGNTSSASVPICFAEAVEQGVIQSGMLTLFVVFGGGVSWGTALLRCDL